MATTLNYGGRDYRLTGDLRTRMQEIQGLVVNPGWLTLGSEGAHQVHLLIGPGLAVTIHTEPPKD